jgi:hypothetical protein
MERHVIRKVFKQISFLTLCAVFGLAHSQSGKEYKSNSMCAEILDQGQKNDCNEAVNSGKIYQIPQIKTSMFGDPTPLFRGQPVTMIPKAVLQNESDAIVSYSIHGDDTTKIISTERRIDVVKNEANLEKLANATVFIAVMSGLSVVAAVVSIIVVGNK